MGQRRIVIYDKADIASETAFRELTHPIEHLMDVDRLAANGAAVGKNVHAIDEIANSVGLLADQLG